MKLLLIPAVILASTFLEAAGCHKADEEVHEEHHKVVVTTPIIEDVTTTKEYVCQIHSCRHIEVRALESGYLDKILIKEGQTVEEGAVLFKIYPPLYKAKLETAQAEWQQAQIEYTNTQQLLQKNVVSQQQLNLVAAKLSKAKAQVMLAQAELNFTDVTAPFGGIVDRLLMQLGSFVGEGDMLTTLSDNSLMWVYFNVPEANYLDYIENLSRSKDELKIELRLANGHMFDQLGQKIVVEAEFNNQTGNIPFRADFPNPNRLLRHGQTGTVLLSRLQKDALVIPQRAVYEILAKQYVYVVGDDNVVHQREIVKESELEDIYLIKEGLDVKDKIVLEGTRQVRDGDTVEYEFAAPKEVLGHLKYHAE